jgi:hypothetical protein
MKFLTREQIFDRVKAQGSVVFTKDDRPYNLNIIAVRSKDKILDAFNDQLLICWQHAGIWYERSYRITTLPGSYYLKTRLLNPLGCAILAPGQYRGVYALRKHNNKYEALCQTNGPVRVYRDNNRNSTFDLRPDKTFLGDYGINVHNSPDGQVTKKVFNHSAGCLVFADDNEFYEAREIWRQAEKEFGNRFTLTLVNE